MTFLLWKEYIRLFLWKISHFGFKKGWHLAEKNEFHKNYHIYQTHSAKSRHLQARATRFGYFLTAICPLLLAIRLCFLPIWLFSLRIWLFSFVIWLLFFVTIFTFGYFKAEFRNFHPQFWIYFSLNLAIFTKIFIGCFW